MLNQISNKIPLWLVILFIVFSLIGFGDAAYLTLKHYTGGTLPCSILNGCEVVTTSAYSTVGPIPISLVGAIYYLIILIASIAYLDSGDNKMMLRMSDFTIIGFVISLLLIYLQVFVIDALCLYCFVSAGTSSILFAMGRYMLKFR